MQTTWTDLPSGIQFRYRERAQFLIEHGYQHDLTIDQLAAQIYEKDQARAHKPIDNLVQGMIR